MPLPGPRSVARLSRAIRDCDAVVIHDALYVTSILALLLAKVRRKRVILIQHISAIPFASPAMRVVSQLANALVTRPMMAAADELVFISRTVQREMLGMPPKRSSHLLFNGVDGATFHRAGGARRQAIRKRWALPVDRSLAVFVGRFVEKKGLSVIQALAVAHPGMHVALVGQGPIDPERWQLANVHVLGQQRQDDLADLYRAADVLLLPSVGEGYPLVIQEAMACGLPVICGKPADSADPAATQWLRGVEIDLRDPTGSAARCAQAIDSLAFSSKDRAAMSRYALDRYDWQAIADGVMDLVCAPSPARVA